MTGSEMEGSALRLYIAGVHHIDPLCRPRLQQWVEALRACEGADPSFVAPEWKEDIFHALKAQRQRLRQMMEEAFPRIPQEVLEACELALAFEAETLLNLFPNAEPVWLDQMRDVEKTDAVVSNLAANRFDDYKDLLGFLGQLKVPGMWDLHNWSLCFWKASCHTLHDEDRKRDKEMGLALKQHLERTLGIDGWGIAVVGTRHAGNKSGVVEVARSFGVLADDVMWLHPGSEDLYP